MGKTFLHARCGLKNLLSVHLGSQKGEGRSTKAYLMNDYESERKLQNSAICVTAVLSRLIVHGSWAFVGQNTYLLVIVSAQNGTIAHLLSAQT